MNIKRRNRKMIAFAITIALLAAGGLLYAAESLSAGTSPDIDYFKGKWVVKMRGNPKQSFNWTVKEDLRGGWMVGVVEQNGEKVSTDFWRRDGKKIERFAFTSGGTFVKIEGSGWETNRLVLTGVASETTGDTKIRETITKVNDRQFQALWESEGPDGKWIVFADEICTK
ncbi:MAG TPA: hypothetical protein VE842_05190 [Pyrinomonadaceae bacterium]|nr:hypothetical protein [Pyrinomonadaceae bacterium]